MRRAMVLVLIAAWAAEGGAESFNARLAKANALLGRGDVEAAMNVYRDLQIEEPESDRLHYAIGCGHYESAQQHLGLRAVEDAREAFEKARDAFEQARRSPGPAVRRNASYNAVNCTAQLALQTAATGKYEEVLEAFRESIAKYEDLLARYPDHEGARQNLDFMRYRLKRMLQNPPKTQPNQRDNSQENQENAPQQQQKQDPQQSNEQQPQESPREQSEDSEQQQGQPEQRQTAESAPNPSEADSEAVPVADASHDMKKERENLDRQSIEAILQSLEEMDQQEQRRVRAGAPDDRPRREWW